jgi:thymidylate synthase ThyX
MTIEAKVILDSVAPNGVRLTTFELTYSRFIHSELMTHRVFSRNSASSRAIPTKKKVERIRKDMAIPSEWGLNKQGMQSDEVLSPEDAQKVEAIWRETGAKALEGAEALDALKCHKQVANRIIEPWDHITVVLSTTKLKNHFKLRLETDPVTGRPLPDPTYYELATKWKAAYDTSTPYPVNTGEWHLPYVFVDRDGKREIEDAGLKDSPIHELKMVSAARCARVSYMRQGQGDLVENKTLHDRLIKGGHWAPLEHVATPINGIELVKWGPSSRRCDFCDRINTSGKLAIRLFLGRIVPKYVCFDCGWGHIHSGNFHGWKQYRKEFPNEAGGD